MRTAHRLALVCTLFALVRPSSAGCSDDEADPTCKLSNDTDEMSAVVLSLSLSNGLSGLPSFAAFVEELGRTYEKGSEEYEQRRNIYAKRLAGVVKHNRNPNRRWDAGVNHLSDRTDEEFAQLRGLRIMKGGDSDSANAQPDKALLDQVSGKVQKELPSEKMWTHLEAIKAESNQDACGSCWAVTSATTLQANAEIKGHGRTFSPQELVSCVPNPHHCGGNGGCKGSTVELAMNWVMEKGLDTRLGTPYLATDSQCKKTSLISNDGANDVDYSDKQLADMIAVGVHAAKSSSSAGHLLGLHAWERLPENEYEPLLRALAEVGPVAVSVGAREWHSYSRGIFDGCARDSVIDHAVTLVGYGEDKSTGDKFWTIKNSWGNDWGEKGFIRLHRQEGKVHCGTDRHPKIGTGCDDAPPTVHVCGMCGILYDSVVPHFVDKTTVNADEA